MRSPYWNCTHCCSAQPLFRASNILACTLHATFHMTAHSTLVWGHLQLCQFSILIVSSSAEPLPFEQIKLSNKTGKGASGRQQLKCQQLGWISQPWLQSWCHSSAMMSITQGYWKNKGKCWGAWMGSWHSVTKAVMGLLYICYCSACNRDHCRRSPREGDGVSNNETERPCFSLSTPPG